jgi:hypothetical protein
MKHFALIAVIALAGCVDTAPYDAQMAACRAATTYGQSFGTPANRGPCWLRTVAHGVSGNIETFMVETPRGFASLTYQRGRMIAASESVR